MSTEGRRGKGACQLKVQVLRVALSKVGLLSLRKGAHYFQEGPTHYEGDL